MFFTENMPIATPVSSTHQTQHAQQNSVLLKFDHRNKIHRDFPTLLQGHLSETQWLDFCDAVDDTSRIRKKVKIILVFVSIVACIILFVQVAAWRGAKIPNFNAWDGPIYQRVPIMFIISFTMILTIIYLYSRYRRLSAKEEYENLNQLCEQMNRKYPQLRFQLVFSADVNKYIEIIAFPNDLERNEYINQNLDNQIVVQNEIVGSGDTNDSIFSMLSNTLPGDHSATIRERLSALEAQRPNLTDAEYAQKRKDILSRK